MLFTGGAEARVVEGGGEAYTQGGRAPRGMSRALHCPILQAGELALLQSVLHLVPGIEDGDKVLSDIM